MFEGILKLARYSVTSCVRVSQFCTQPIRPDLAARGIAQYRVIRRFLLAVFGLFLSSRFTSASNCITLSSNRISSLPLSKKWYSLLSLPKIKIFLGCYLDTRIGSLGLKHVILMIGLFGL